MFAYRCFSYLFGISLYLPVHLFLALSLSILGGIENHQISFMFQRTWQQHFFLIMFIIPC